MKTVQLNNQLVDEKIALAKELGLNNCAQAMAQAREQIKILTDLKFKLITRSEIEKMIERRVFRFRYHDDSGVILGIFLIGLFITGFVGTLVGFQTVSHDFEWLPIKILGGLTLIADLTAIVFTSFPRCTTERMDLLSWMDSLPRGALLALKEAKEAGISNFEIWFPKLESKRVYDADPVITGTKEGINIRLMIHAWDDGKVHD